MNPVPYDSQSRKLSTRLLNVKVILNVINSFDNTILNEQREQEDILTRSFNGLELSGEEERQAIFNTEPVVSDDISKVIIANEGFSIINTNGVVESGIYTCM